MSFLFRATERVSVAVIFILLTSCTGQRTPYTPERLVVALDTAPTNLDPRIGIDKASEDFSHLLYNGLLRKNEQDRMVPDLAESFQKVSPVVYRFYLRKGVRFHNGKILEAKDVVFTYRSILSGEAGSTKRSVLESIQDVVAISSDVVEIRLREPFNGLLFNLNTGIVPAGSSRDFARNPIGTGPYRLVHFEADGDSILEAFADHFAGAPRIPRLVLRVIPDATTRALELRKGGVDLTFGHGILPPHYFRLFKNEPHLKTLIGRGNNYAYIGFNLRDPILKNKKVRQAIAYAISREQMVKSLFYGTAELATGLLAPHHWAYEGNVRRFDHNPERAKKLLDQAGYPDPDGDGPKKRFRLEYKTTTSDFRKMVAAIIQKDLDRVGIELEVRSYEWGTFFSDVNKGNFQMCMLLWVGESDPDIYRNVFSTPGSRNRGKYSDPQVDEWVNLAKTASSESDQKKYYSLIQKKVAEDCPYVSLWYESVVAVMRKELQGMQLTPDADYRVLKDVYWESSPAEGF